MCISLPRHFLHLRAKRGGRKRRGRWRERETGERWREREEGGGKEKREEGEREPDTNQHWELAGWERGRHTHTSSIVASSFP